MVQRLMSALCLVLTMSCGNDDTSDRISFYGEQDSEISNINSGDTTGGALPTKGDDDEDTTDADGGDSIISDTEEIGDTVMQTMTLEACLSRTPDLETCVACCDCKQDACDDRETCRQACETVDYAKNVDLIDFDATIDLGADGTYTDCFMRGEEQACKSCCDCADYQCGDYPYCRAVCENIS